VKLAIGGKTKPASEKQNNIVHERSLPNQIDFTEVISVKGFQ
jgi:hypothetical protein